MFDSNLFNPTLEIIHDTRITKKIIRLKVKNEKNPFNLKHNYISKIYYYKYHKSFWFFVLQKKQFYRKVYALLYYLIAKSWTFTKKEREWRWKRESVIWLKENFWVENVEGWVKTKMAVNWKKGQKRFSNRWVGGSIQQLEAVEFYAMTLWNKIWTFDDKNTSARVLLEKLWK